MATIETITAFHALRQHTDWPKKAEPRAAAFAKAQDYQRSFYPVRAVLTADEQELFDTGMALLALEMIDALPVRSERVLKSLKETSSSGASTEEEYEASSSDPFPQITALFARLAPVPASPAVRFSRMRP